MLANFQGRLDHRLRVEPQRVPLDAAFHDLKGAALPAKGLQIEGLAADGLEVTARPLKDGRRSGEALAGEHGREDRVAAGVGVGATFPHGDIADARLVQSQVGGYGQVQSLVGLLLGQPQSLGCSQGAGDAADGDVVESLGFQVHGVAHPAEGFVSHHGGGYEPLTAGPGHFGGRQGGRDAVAGMSRLLTGVAVVEIQVADHHPVGKGRHVRAGGLAAAQDGGRLGAGQHRRQVSGQFAGLSRITAKGAAQGVDDHALGLVHNLRRQVLKTQRRGKGTQTFRYGSHIKASAAG